RIQDKHTHTRTRAHTHTHTHTHTQRALPSFPPSQRILRDTSSTSAIWEDPNSPLRASHSHSLSFLLVFLSYSLILFILEVFSFVSVCAYVFMCVEGRSSTLCSN